MFKFPPPPPVNHSLPITLLFMGALILALTTLGLRKRQRSFRWGDVLLWIVLTTLGIGVVRQTWSASFHFDLLLHSALCVNAAAIAGVLVAVLRPMEPRFWRRCGPGLSMFGGLAAFVGVMLSLPSIGSHPPAQRTLCLNNLRTCGIALVEFAKSKGALPRPAGPEGDVPRSWRVEVLPWMEQGRLREKFRENQAWSSAENERIARQRMVVFQCPSNFTPTDASQRFYTSFVAVTGSRTTFSDIGRRNFPENITDGADETLMLLEASGQQIVWTEPRDADVDAMPLGLNLDGREIGRSPGIGSSYHPGGVNAVFAGGNSQFLSEDIDPEVLRALLTIDGAEAVDDF